MGLTIDGIGITTLGFKLLDVNGEFDVPSFKIPFTNNWAEYDGVEVSVSNKLNTREIVIKLLLTVDNSSEFDAALAALQNLIYQPGLRVLKLRYKKYPIFVRLNNDIVVNPLNGFGMDSISADITMIFIEPYPVGRYFLIESPDVFFNIGTTKIIKIVWESVAEQTIPNPSEESAYSVERNGLPIGGYFGIFGIIDSIWEFSSLSGATEIL